MAAAQAEMALRRSSTTQSSCLIVTYSYGLNDPTTRHAAVSLSQEGRRVTIFQLPSSGGLSSAAPPNIDVFDCPMPILPASAGALYRLAKWRRFRRELRSWIEQNRPDLVLTIMLHALAALPKHSIGNDFRLLSCVYDIPSPQDAGRLDTGIVREAWGRLPQADVVWASDIYKAQLTKKFSGLDDLPIVCHNCPTLDYSTEPLWPRDGWLRAELRKAGAVLNDNEGCILIRAGAVGECGGIEETLEAMRDLPENFVFLMMGRPSQAYRESILRKINALDLQKRAFLWDRPSDEIWLKALYGADIGHLIHGPFSTGYLTRLAELNSSLSNYRLFNYMAVGLPIIAYDDPRMEQIYNEVPCFRVIRLEHLVEDMKRVFFELRDNPSLRKSLGAAGRQAHEYTYCWERQVEKILRAVRNSDA